MAKQLSSRYDIIINGGGIVGFSLLNSILRSPYLKQCKVLLIEHASQPNSLKQSPRYDQSSGSNWNHSDTDSQPSRRVFSNRVSSITRKSKLALENLGVWDTIRPYAKNVRRIKVWNYDYSDKIVFNQNQPFSETDENERDVMFSVIENNRLSLALLDSIHKCPQGKDAILWGHSLNEIRRSNTSELITVVANSSSEEKIEVEVEAPLVLGCDGYKSRVRNLLGMRYNEFDLNKTAIVGTVKMLLPESQAEENDVAYQRFSAEKDTVAALLPLDRQHSSFVISAPIEFAKYLMDCDAERFADEFNNLLTSSEPVDNIALQTIHNLTNSFCNRVFPQTILGEDIGNLPTVESVIENSQATFPLLFGTTTPNMIATIHGQQSPRVALLGDASHRVHPLAGQGLNLGIQDALELVKQLEYFAERGERVFESESIALALKRYERNRQLFIAPISAGILAFPTLFKLTPSRILSAVNKCKPIKEISVKMAGGF